jgi:uncharacterized coiled-coil DUF342 family protein
METKKISEQELKEIKTLRDNFNSAYANLGMLVARIKELEDDKDKTFQYIDELKESETKIYETLKTTYGDGVIDLNTGEFKPQN